VRDDGGVLLLASPSADPTPIAQKGIEVSPLLGLIVLAMGIALFFLIRSLRTQVRKIDFDDTALSDEDRARGRRRNPPAST
jgi:hypothetical protein